MIWLPAFLFLTVFAVANSEDLNEVEDVPQKNDGDECDADSYLNIVCENDKLKFCGPNNQMMSIPCVLGGKQAFCNCEKNACVPQKPVCSEEKTKCYAANTKMPDNLDCHKFSYCNDKLEKMMLECPGNLIYDPIGEKCTDINSARCTKVACPRPGNSLQLIPFPNAKNYYVLCYQGMGDVRKCTDKYYSVKNNRCQFDCKLRNESGLFQDSNEEKCKKGVYFACRRSGTNFTTIQAQCPPGKIFDETKGLCTADATCGEPKKDDPPKDDPKKDDPKKDDPQEDDTK